MAESSKRKPARSVFEAFDLTTTMHDIAEAARQRDESLAHTLSLERQSVRDFERVTSAYTLATAGLRKELDYANFAISAPLISAQAEFDKTKSLLSGLALSDVRTEFSKLDALRTPPLESRSPSADIAKMGALTLDVPSYVRNRPPETTGFNVAAALPPAGDLAKSFRSLVPPVPQTPPPPPPPLTKAELVNELRTIVKEALGRDELKSVMKEVLDELVQENMPAPPEEPQPLDDPRPWPGQYL